MMKQKILFLVVFLCLAGFFIFSQKSTAITPAANFTVGNAAPPTPTIFGAYNDTTAPYEMHSNASGVWINWSEGVDTNGDAIVTFMCISTTSAKRTALNCDVVDNLTDINKNISNGATGYIFSGKEPNFDWNTSNDNITFWVKLVPNDGQANGTALDVEFNLTNSDPTTPSTLDTTATHDNTPTVGWTASTDSDINPVDTKTYHINVSAASSGPGDIANDATSASNSYTLNALAWGNATDTTANRTIYLRVWTTDGHAGGRSGLYDVSFVLYDNLPDILEVKITDTEAYGNCSSSCTIDPTSHGNATVAVKVRARDIDNECGTNNHSAYLHLCRTATGSCDENNNNNYVWQIDNVSNIGDCCEFTFTANKTDGPEYFRENNTAYKYHINVTSRISNQEMMGDAGANGTWVWNALLSVNYTDTIGLGPTSGVTLGAFNVNASAYNMTNYGNDQLNLSWNMSNFGGPAAWNLNGTDFWVDYDRVFASDKGNITHQNLSVSLGMKWVHPTGLLICGSMSCFTPYNASLETYFHFYPPAGLAAGTYSSNITITLTNDI